MLSLVRAAVSRQLAHPAGPAGRIVAALMNRGNRGLNQRAIERLELAADSRVLDLGFGGGVTLPTLLARAAHVVAIDRAPEMVAAARRRHPDAVAGGRLDLRTGQVDPLPLADGAVDRILTVNTVYFWPDLPAALAELRRVLAPGGRLVIGIRDGPVMDQVDRALFTVRPPAELAAALREAGFARVAVDSAADGSSHLLVADLPQPPT
ncbi:class I SAM-dependent methyltransferase [Patulibacter defluvii]|uniref:class I SAM-dependent methyltransferase n=1 Tax=Patulibacter defluvii TaxID=3095358 RepID=UPI002A75F94B|nr:class I SAM-dependent methyltransferase [Patulibacter sp. DM4]